MSVSATEIVTKSRLVDAIRARENWEDMSLDALWRYLNCEQLTARRAPQSTYDALLWELREYGSAQLAKERCRGRLARLSTDQLRELIAALMRLRSRHPHISDDLLLKLREQLP